MLPLQPLDESRPKPKGRGAWKQWTPEALLRSAFGEATATVRQSASEIDGASAAHVIKARMFIAKCILDCQDSHVQSERNRLSQSGMQPRVSGMLPCCKICAAWCLKLPNALLLLLNKILGQKTKVKLWALQLTKAKLGGNWPGSG